MGCFLACFGSSKKRKRPKRLHKATAADQKYGNYEALDSSLTANLVPFSEFRDGDKYKEQTSGKGRKKVRFNLNVQIYEPNPTAYQILVNEEEQSHRRNGETEGSAALTMTYPSNYRYYNWREDCNEDEEFDIDAYDGDDDDEFDDGNDSDDSKDNNEVEAYNLNTKKKELLESYNQLPLVPNDAGLKSSGQDRSKQMHSVLSPVENLTQWKAIKAKFTSSNKDRTKENAPPEQKKSRSLVSDTSFNFSPFRSESKVHHSKPLLPEIAVDASLSNWLISPDPNISITTVHCQ